MEQRAEVTAQSDSKENQQIENITSIAKPAEPLKAKTPAAQ